MARKRNQREWLKEFEGVNTPPRPRSISIRPGKRQPTKPDWAYKGTPRGSATLPDFEWRPPSKQPSTGITQEPNSPWGVAIQDPLEKQFVTVTPSGIPVLRSRARWSVPQVVQGGYTPSYGANQYSSWGGGGGGSWGGYQQAASVPRWWDPGLYNWRYGVTY